ncbi:hypothetical protein ACEQ8H_008915 [Pleosporales sp. CAS-2024a]
MASKLCCVAEQDGRPDSPDLPNARVNTATPNWPLLSKQGASPGSRVASTRSEELHALRRIFDNAQEATEERAAPQRAPRPRTSRPSMYSLHSLHKMTSMRSILKKKFSKDLSRKKSNVSVQQQARKRVAADQPHTMIKHTPASPRHALGVPQDDLPNDLLSDKKPAEGGYDPDAEVLDIVARNVAKGTPSKRPSIHSIDWAPSSASKSTAASSTQQHGSRDVARDLPPYQLNPTQPTASPHGFAQVLSTPNLRAELPAGRARECRRSHSATSMRLPKPSPLSPLRIPSLTHHHQHGKSWAQVMTDSLRLSTFPLPTRHPSLKPSKTDLVSHVESKNDCRHNSTEQVRMEALEQRTSNTALPSTPRAVEIRLQQPTSIASPRPSGSVRREFGENACPIDDVSTEPQDEDDRRRSVHLHSMRISHHLRSASLLSWDQLADAPELPSTPGQFRQRTVSAESRHSPSQTPQLFRHERHTSSSGFASSKVPSRWGRVMPSDRGLRADVASSVYSSRPQSPPDSFGASMADLSPAGTVYRNFSQSSVELGKLQRSRSFHEDNDETPRPLQRQGAKSVAKVRDMPPNSSLLAGPPLLARKHSAADIKKSKFKEEFSPSPPKKKLNPSTSIIKFFNPKRLSMRSLSETNLSVDAPKPNVDGAFEPLALPVDRERRQSRSLISLRAEQDALGKDKGVNHVWDKALKAHQEERASMFLPKNKDLAVHANPFRERSGSSSSRRPSFQEDQEATVQVPTPNRYSAPVFATDTFGTQASSPQPALITRRSATAGRDALSPAQEVAEAFETQGDAVDIVGAWGRYPSHTRAERTLHLGTKQRVETRDFALETAIQFASAKGVEQKNHDEDMIDPTERMPSPKLLPGQKKRKKKIGTGNMAKSHSMTFGRKLIKDYYAGMFKSSSSEFRQHGRGHRSSIASGGNLEHPELELLPDIFMSGAHHEAGGKPEGQNDGAVTCHSGTSPKGKLPTEDSMATLRPRRNSSAPDLHDLVRSYDGADDAASAQDRARAWSVYYENCVSSFPRINADNNYALEDFGGPSHVWSHSRRGSRRSNTVPTRHSRHSRNVSQVSRLSNASQRSGRAKRWTMGDGDEDENQSLVSVRRSTIDLISMFKEQESMEHEHILSLTRAESKREAEHVIGL